MLDASRLACPSVNMDEMFRKKLQKNKERPHQYGEGHRKRVNEWLRLNMVVLTEIVDELCGV